VLLEFALQRVLMDALLDGNASVARTRLASVPPATPGYASLALAATLRAEGKDGESARALEEWRRTAERNPGWIIGNQWALDRLEREPASHAETGRT
jgi:hypothetical protein